MKNWLVVEVVKWRRLGRGTRPSWLHDDADVGDLRWGQTTNGKGERDDASDCELHRVTFCIWMIYQ